MRPIGRVFFRRRDLFMNITILGAGAWGTALAISLAASHAVVLWGREPDLMREAQARRENRTYLPGFALPDGVTLTADFDAAVAHVGDDGLLLVATSLAGLRPIATRLKGRSIPNIVWLCKGFEEQTHLLPHQIVREVLGDGIPAGALSGPSFAQEVAQGLPGALVVASADAALRQRVVDAGHGRHLRVYATDDLAGDEVRGDVQI